jgi:hypothetical protein
LRTSWSLSAGAIHRPALAAKNRLPHYRSDSIFKRLLSRHGRARKGCTDPHPSWPGERHRSAVFAPEVPATHVLLSRRKTWMPATSAGMTSRLWRCFTTSAHARAGGHPALDPRVRGDDRRLSQRFTCQTAKSCSQVFNTNKRHHPYCLARPRVGPSSRLSPLKI